MIDYATKIENRIELQVERKMDRLDARLMAGTLTQLEYDAEVKKLNLWADSEYAMADRARGWKV